MDPTPVGQRLRAWRIVACRREQLALQRRVVELGRDRPSDADHRRPANVFRDRRAADPDRLGDHPGARPIGILQAQNFSYLPHRQSLGGHRTSPCWLAKGATLPRSDCRQRNPLHPIHRVAAFDRNRWPLSPRIGWPLSVGISGRLGSDSASRRSPDRCWSLTDVYTRASLGTADRESTVVVWVTLTPACWCSPSRKTKFLSGNSPDFSETSWAVRTLYSWTEEARQVSIRRSRGGRAIWCLELSNRNRAKQNSVSTAGLRESTEGGQPNEAQ